MTLNELFLSLILLFESRQPLASFDKAIPHVLKHEGGLVNDKDDKGGLTNYGLSYQYLKGLVREDPNIIHEIDLNGNNKLDSYDVVNMSQIEAKEIYYEGWWKKYGYGKLNHQGLATKLFDMAVNMGPLRPLQWLREESNLILRSSPILNDQEAKHINSKSFIEKNALIKKLEKRAIEYYYSIVDKNPSQKKFLKGWLARTTSKID